ncbi:PmbA/TldA family metallopeptidase, partial [Noviherbaspirillum denitrificans]|uniref:PmbA/TldA family metallopeptidase n=1 Tax=Noviherbaspirillum denitrificans TaxID=1968433 RepID=UPI002351E194
MLDSIRSLFRSRVPAVDFCSLRLVEESSEQLSVRQDVLQPLSTGIDRGAMVTVVHRGGYGYAATSDLSAAGLTNAIARARRWAEASAGRSVVDYAQLGLYRAQGRYATPPSAPVPARRDLIDLLMRESASCHVDTRVVDWQASLWNVTTSQLYLTADGADIEQQFRYLVPNLSVT